MATKKPKPTGPFRKVGRAYYLESGGNPKGIKLDGVTTILGNGIPKPALVEWASRVTAEEAVDRWDELSEMPVAKRLAELKGAKNRQRDWAAKRGTEVHNLAEKLANGEEVEVPDEIRGHVESAVKFLDDFDVEIILTETPCYNDKALYGGTFDLLLRSKLPEHAGKVILADWKTNRSGIFAETALQLTAYANATHYLGADNLEHSMAELGITDLWAIWVRSDDYSVYPMEFSSATWATFSYAAGIARSISDKEVAAEWKGEQLRPGAAA
ncbi:hypothetical protein [Pseudoclavibacter sp. RFBB5]|uniref:hypothetical protein n=1 Tax=Pseudoclavibacter sp. RFBB5 TaxID=2080574 RepID=UPI000CE81D93|nr:hypothetical protein [Pseudoclavibacter sp. RFBB5]PPG29674.1 hypothetical protein C5B97_11940 [Pseudoclavibacter sp. RFBB5]